MLLATSIGMLIALCIIVKVLKATNSNIVVLIINFTSTLIPMLMLLTYSIGLFLTDTSGSGTYFNVAQWWTWFVTDTLANLANVIFVLMLWFISSKNQSN
jgi:hypothetical protein